MNHAGVNNLIDLIPGEEWAEAAKLLISSKPRATFHSVDTRDITRAWLVLKLAGKLERTETKEAPQEVVLLGMDLAAQRELVSSLRADLATTQQKGHEAVLAWEAKCSREHRRVVALLKVQEAVGRWVNAKGTAAQDDSKLEDAMHECSKALAEIAAEAAK